MRRLATWCALVIPTILLNTPNSAQSSAVKPAPMANSFYRWGSPAMHCWRVSFLANLADTGFKPALHRSSKPLKAWQDGGISEVQGWKSERFIFDLIPQPKTSVGLFIDRDDEFAPVKNAEGTDSPASARQLMSDCHRRWLEAAGVEVALGDGQLIEISPRFAGSPQSFAGRWDKRLERVEGDYYLEENL